MYYIYFKADAEELYSAGEDRWGTDETVFTLILARRSLLQLRCILEKYEEVAGNSLESAIESECSRHSFCNEYFEIYLLTRWFALRIVNFTKVL